MELKKNSRVYIIAIAGTGMSALAGLFKEMGCEVAGSDVACYPPVSDLLKALNITVKLEYDVEHLKSFKPDYVVIGNFVRKDNPQAQWVIANNIPYGSMPSTLEEFFLPKTKNYVVAGTHGKSTTSTCLAHLFRSASRDPSFLIGAVSNDLDRSFALGKGKEFVLEGDEYDTAFFDKESKFLHYRPHTVLWTSLEFDHADIFPSMERLELMFRKLLAKIPADGELIYCRDWKRVHEMVEEERESSLRDKTIVSYGFSPESQIKIENFIENAQGIQFQVLGESFSMSMPGKFNAQNATAALIAAKRGGVSFEILKSELANFKGLKRRQEVRIEKNGTRVIDDFAHHPTAVKQVLEALRAKYPDTRIVAFFEARSNTTRRNFFQQEFVEAFRSADLVLLPEVFRKETLVRDEALDISRLVSDVNKVGTTAHGPITVDEMLELAQIEIKKGPCSLVVLSNGTFEGLHQRLISLIDSH